MTCQHIDEGLPCGSKVTVIISARDDQHDLYAVCERGHSTRPVILTRTWAQLELTKALRRAKEQSNG